MYSGEKQFIEQNIDIFWCPKCHDPFTWSDKRLKCLDCDTSFVVADEIP